jgi:uncharacterized membrane protein HdeD (DUF308 family)
MTPASTTDHENWNPAVQLVTASWQLTLFFGFATLVLGIIVALHPSGSLNVIAVLLGILMLLSGVFHLIRMFNPAESHRVWLGIAGLLFIVIGVVFIRHLHLTLAIIGLLIGLSWIVQGVVTLIAGFSAEARPGRVWWIIFGLVSLAAGIVVVAVPVKSVHVLAVLFGIWFIVMGLFEILGAFVLRHALHETTKAASGTAS